MDFWIFQPWIDSMGGRDFLLQNMWLLGLAMMLITVVSGVFMFMRGRWTAYASENIAKNMRDRLYAHLQSLSYKYHVKAETGDLIQRCTSDVETVRRFLSGQLVEVFRCVLMVSIALPIMIRMNGFMTLMSMILVPFLFAFSMLYFKWVIKSFRETDEAEGKMSAVLQENLTGVRVVRAFGRAKYEIDKFEIASGGYSDKAIKLTKLMAIYWSTSDLLSISQGGITLLTGVYLASTGQLLVGEMTVFISYVGMLLWPIRALGRILTDMGKAAVSLERIDEILREKPETVVDGALEPEFGDIVFDNVEFRYEDAKPILNGVSFNIPKGSTLAILGATGSGKSTLVHLLQRLYDLKGGKITINGVDILDIKKEYLRTKIGLVLQEPFLYSRSVKDNIGIAKPGQNDEQIFDSAGIACAHEFINDFEKGYDTVVGERGVTLSGGQKQRVAIARMLCKDNEVMIFDDSLSAVDTQTDAQIRDALNHRRKDITTIIISHRITTLSQADKVIVLEGGKVAQQGTHEELLSQPGLYQRINAIQTQLEEELESELS